MNKNKTNRANTINSLNGPKVTSFNSTITISELSNSIDILKRHGIDHPTIDPEHTKELAVLQNKILNSKTTQKYQNPIVLIGGGISGQYSAFILQKLGFDNITILEKSNTIEGGRCNTVQLNGNNCFPGAMRIPKDELIDNLLDYLEIPTKPFHNDTPTSVVLTVDDLGNAKAITKENAIKDKILKLDLSEK
jgi:hypothetical protein